MLGKRMSVGRDRDPVMKPCVKKGFCLVFSSFWRFGSRPPCVSEVTAMSVVLPTNGLLFLGHRADLRIMWE